MDTLKKQQIAYSKKVSDLFFCFFACENSSINEKISVNIQFVSRKELKFL